MGGPLLATRRGKPCHLQRAGWLSAVLIDKELSSMNQTLSAVGYKSQVGIESSDVFVVLWSDGHFSAICVTLLDLFYIGFFFPVSSFALLPFRQNS